MINGVTGKLVFILSLVGILLCLASLTVLTLFHDTVPSQINQIAWFLGGLAAGAAGLDPRGVKKDVPPAPPTGDGP